MQIVKIIIVIGLVAFLGYQIFMLIKTIKQQKKVNQDDLKEVNTSVDKNNNIGG